MTNKKVHKIVLPYNNYIYVHEHTHYIIQARTSDYNSVSNTLWTAGIT